ncbi:MAG: CDP-glycerol glycerophosphotransferase family protein [Chromatiales bacterium]|nr:CDP-glycerol glycerophosphotransferase family protein [Gammaproteobacteria bacterium]MBW6477315.1 CDP-glycerol glycerophosphotransferase family protein [Chromatiales bacterium]
MAKKYLFFVNAEYCYAILRPLQEIIHRRGGETAWFVFGCSSAPLNIHERLVSSVAEALAFKPDAVIAPGDWIPYFLPGKKVQVFHGIARNKRGAASEDSSDHYRIRGWFDLYCTHSEHDTLKFQQLAERHGNFHVVKTGWPKLDPLFQEQEHYRQRPQNSVPTVFFASTFSPSITAAPELADTIERLSATGKWRFIVTLHPKMAGDTVARYQAIKNPYYSYIPAGEDIFEPMAQADIMLCDTSSIMYEFLFLDKPLVTLRTRNPGPYLHDIQDVEQLEAALEHALKRPEEQMQAARALCGELHGFHDGESSERVLNAIEALCDGTLGPLKRKPLNIIRKLRLRARMRYWKP